MPTRNCGTAMPSWPAADSASPSGRGWRIAAKMPSGTAIEQRQHGRGQDQRAGDRELLAELAGHRRVGERRAAEVAVHDAADPLDVLRDQRPVRARAPRGSSRHAARGMPRCRRCVPRGRRAASGAGRRSTTLATKNAATKQAEAAQQKPDQQSVHCRGRHTRTVASACPGRSVGERCLRCGYTSSVGTTRPEASKRAFMSNSGKPATPVRADDESSQRGADIGGGVGGDDVRGLRGAGRSLRQDRLAALAVGEQLLHLRVVVVASSSRGLA